MGVIAMENTQGGSSEEYSNQEGSKAKPGLFSYVSAYFHNPINHDTNLKKPTGICRLGVILSFLLLCL